VSTILNIDKKKIENFWYYYKIHTFVGIFVAIMLLITLKDCANNVVPDITISYVGKNYIADEVGQKLKEKLSGVIQDINNDKKKELLFQPMTLSDEIRSEQDIAMQQKVMVTFAAGDTQIFLMDKTNFLRFAEQGAFQPLDDVAAKCGVDINKNPEIKLTARETTEAHVYGVPLEGNSMLEEIGFKTKDTYIALRILGEKDKQNEKKKVLYNNVYEIFQEIVKYNKK
jgi:hypothetical protein